MTTTVSVFPHPGQGLKVEVKVVEKGQHGAPERTTVVYPKSGELATFYAHDGAHVVVAEVPDTLPEKVGEIPQPPV